MTPTQMPQSEEEKPAVDHLFKLKEADITNQLSPNVAPATMNRLELLGKMKPFAVHSLLG